jgi:hypothetical protein
MGVEEDAGKIAGIARHRRHRAGSEEPDLAANKREWARIGKTNLTTEARREPNGTTRINRVGRSSSMIWWMRSG